MTDPTIASATFSLGLYDCPSGRVEAECLGQDSALADKIQLRVRNEAQGVIAFLYLTPAQARGLRLALSQALEAHYREHPEQLGADIERDLTMELVPDLADPFNDAEEREANLRTARQFIQPDPADQLRESRELLEVVELVTAEELEALAYLRAEQPVQSSRSIPGVTQNRISLGRLLDWNLIHDLDGRGWQLTVRGEEVLEFFDADLVQPVSIDEAVQRG